ncbi:FkbM family methyltransferase [Candidatus Omnitrophota bacterium]
MKKKLEKKRNSYASSSYEEKEKFGYGPNIFVRIGRVVARCIIAILRLNSNSRLIVEIQQMLDPSIRIRLPGKDHLIFCTGHGRLLWRAKTLFTEEKLIIRWIDLFKNDDIFFDIGANIGGYSLYAAKTKGVKVYAFEPEINNLQTLYANIYKNGLNDLCIPVPLASDNETKIKPFFIREFSKGGAFNTIGRKSSFSIEEKDMFVQDTLCMKVDDMIKQFGLQYPTKVKIDVDANELQVIEGMTKTLDYVKEIYIELLLSFDEHKKVKDILERRGFKVADSEKARAPKQYEAENYIFRRIK